MSFTLHETPDTILAFFIPRPWPWVCMRRSAFERSGQEHGLRLVEEPAPAVPNEPRSLSTIIPYQPLQLHMHEQLLLPRRRFLKHAGVIPLGANWNVRARGTGWVSEIFRGPSATIENAKT
jgi:hypothetical protein